MQTDWGTAIVVDPRLLETLRNDNERLRAARHLFGAATAILLAIAVVTSGIAHWQVRRAGALEHAALKSQKRAASAQTALASLATSHESILAATEQVPSADNNSWARRFTVTKYIPRSPAYGKTNDGFTSTMVRADPAARIVAVDPKVIPYKSWVWIEGLGWYRADDCGGAIRGFSLDVLTDTVRDAFAFGRQDRFVIVVPATA